MVNRIMAALPRALLLLLATKTFLLVDCFHAHSIHRQVVRQKISDSRCHHLQSEPHRRSAAFGLTPSARIHAAAGMSSTTTRNFASAADGDEQHDMQPTKFEHTLAVLTMPTTSMDRIANEAILDTAAEYTTKKLSIMLRCEDEVAPSLASLRRYVGEVYSCLWDVALGMGNPDDIFDVVVYAQNLPNSAPEQWIHHQADLDCVCSHDSLMGWISTNAQGRGVQYQSVQGRGQGGLDAHVSAINADRQARDLHPVRALHVDPWPIGATPSPEEAEEDSNVIFLDDDDLEPCTLSSLSPLADDESGGENLDDVGDDPFSMIAGPRIPQEVLFDNVAVGGTFDGMHYGHRKLLTLAISSVNPMTGRLMVGVTVDEMLTHKAYSEQIPLYDERMKGARDFVYRFAPGMKNRISFIPISDAFGPPGTQSDGASFDALVLSHETLENGYKLNEHRKDVLNMEPLTLLCTRRTEPHGMSSTALRRLRSQRTTSDVSDNTANEAVANNSS